MGGREPPERDLQPRGLCEQDRLLLGHLGLGQEQHPGTPLERTCIFTAVALSLSRAGLSYFCREPDESAKRTCHARTLDLRAQRGAPRAPISILDRFWHRFCFE